MSKEEIDNLVNYLDSIGPADMVDGTYEVKLTKSELEYIVESINIG